MGLLDELLGGGQRQTEFRDFIDRFGRGTPPAYDDISDQEATERYREVTPELSRQQYRESAEEAFARLSPAERAEFARWMRTRVRDQGLQPSEFDLDGDGVDDRMQDPGRLAEATTKVRDRDPNVFEQLLGKGGTGGALDNPVAKIALAGIAAMAAQRLMGGRR